MDYKSAIKLINKAYEKDLEDKVYQMWLTLYPNMDKNNFISFEDFKAKVMIKNIQSLSSAEDVLKEVSEIRKKLERR